MENQNSQAMLRHEISELLKAKSRKEVAKLAKMNLNEFYMVASGYRKVRKKTAVKYFKHLIKPQKWKKIERRFEFEERKQYQDEDRSRIDVDVLMYSGTHESPSATKDQAEVHSDYYYCALVILFELEDFNPSMKWISGRLGLPVKRIEEMLKRLHKLGLIDRKDGKYTRTGKRLGLTWPQKIDPSWRRMKQIQKLVFDAKDIDKDLKYERDLTFAIDPADLPLVKDATIRYLNQIEKIFRPSRSKEVFAVSVNLFPVTKVSENALSKNSPN